MIGDNIDITFTLNEQAFDDQDTCIVCWDETAELLLAAAAIGLEGCDRPGAQNLWTMVLKLQSKIKRLKGDPEAPVICDGERDKMWKEDE